jgi:hypothetical protein
MFENVDGGWLMPISPGLVVAGKAARTKRPDREAQTRGTRWMRRVTKTAALRRKEGGNLEENLGIFRLFPPFCGGGEL